jgi:hypothetical protein
VTYEGTDFGDETAGEKPTRNYLISTLSQLPVVKWFVTAPILV